MTIVVEPGSPDLGTNQPGPAPEQRLVAGRFRLIDQLGRGGMGRVYRAHDEVLNRPVAVKLIYDDAVRDRDLHYACALEARAAASLNHPGIVRILDSGFDDGHCYVVMSLAEGRTLAEILREDGPLSVDRALDLTIQVADALSAAHQEGVIHCDVKPGNLLVDADWRVRLVDFGIARVTSSTTGLTGEMLQGSAQYVAPEQVEGASVDGRTDLYALGTVLYEMLAGRTPFGGGTIASILARRLVTDPPSLREINPSVPPRVEQVVFKALARDPDQRFQTAAELRNALIPIRHEIPMFPVSHRAREQTGRLPAWIGAGAVAPALPRFSWDGPRRRIIAGAAYATGWTSRTSGRAREVAGTVLPDAMARAQLLTPARRPTMRAGVVLAVLVGLLMGTVAAKCGVSDVSADAALASEPAAVIRPTPPSAPPVQFQAPAVVDPVVQVVPPTATQPPPPTPVPPTATVTAPTTVPEPETAIADVAPPAAPPPPVRSAPAPAPPVRALSAPPPAPVAPVEDEAPPAAPAAPVENGTPPAPSAAESRPKPQPEDDDEKPRPLSNTPRLDDKSPEERQKAELKRSEPEKRNDPPKQSDPPKQNEPEKQPDPPKPQPVAPPKEEPPKPDPPKQADPPKPQPAAQPRAEKPDPPKQETKKSEPKAEQRGGDDDKPGNKKQRDKDD